MHHLDEVASAFRVRLEYIADWVYGCRHRRTSLPVTLRTGISLDARQSAQSETYIVCLECGRHIPYNWSTMRSGPERAAWVGTRAGLGGISDKRDVAQASTTRQAAE